VLEGNQGQVSALAFSPNGNYLVAGDVRLSPLHYLSSQLMIFMQSSGKIILFDAQERKVNQSNIFHELEFHFLLAFCSSFPRDGPIIPHESTLSHGLPTLHTLPRAPWIHTSMCGVFQSS